METGQDTSTRTPLAFVRQFPSQGFRMALRCQSVRHARFHRIYSPIDQTPKIDRRDIPSSRQGSRHRNCPPNLAIHA